MAILKLNFISTDITSFGTAFKFISNGEEFIGFEPRAGSQYHWELYYGSTLVAYSGENFIGFTWINKNYEIIEYDETQEALNDNFLNFLNRHGSLLLEASSDGKYVINGKTLLSIGEAVADLLNIKGKIALSQISSAISIGKEKQYNAGFQAMLNQLINPDDGYIIKYTEWVDSEGQTLGGASGTLGDKLVGPGYENNNENIEVPVLYNIQSGSGKDFDIDRYYYIGSTVIDDIEYDKWRKIEGTGDFTWDESAQIYAYTDKIIH